MKKLVFVFITGVFLSLLATTSVRFLTQAKAEEKKVHYHSDFMIHINGEMRMLDDPKYYEETTSTCSLEGYVHPKERAHLHDMVSTVIHVEDNAVTYGHFLQNLGYGLTDKVIADDKGNVFKSEEAKKLRFILNGKEIDSIQNKIIENKDRLLISYGPESAQELIDGKFNEVTEKAEEYNNTPDPESCSGKKKGTFAERLKKAFIN